VYLLLTLFVIIFLEHALHCAALQAAGTIHTDFERGFICAEVMHYEELHELGNEHAVKAAGKYRQEGKNYTVADGDIIFFVSLFWG
jgi:obg-like ATPase 1